MSHTHIHTHMHTPIYSCRNATELHASLSVSQTEGVLLQTEICWVSSSEAKLKNLTSCCMNDSSHFKREDCIHL